MYRPKIWLKSDQFGPHKVKTKPSHRTERTDRILYKMHNKYPLLFSVHSTCTDMNLIRNEHPFRCPIIYFFYVSLTPYLPVIALFCSVFWKICNLLYLRTNVYILCCNLTYKVYSIDTANFTTSIKTNNYSRTRTKKWTIKSCFVLLFFSSFYVILFICSVLILVFVSSFLFSLILYLSQCFRLRSMFILRVLVL